MRNVIKYIFAFLALSGLCWTATDCTQIPEVMEELELDRCLTPANLRCVSAGESVTFTWTSSKGSTSYYIEIYSDETDPDGSVIDKASVSGNTLTFEGLEIDRTFYARIKGVSETIGDSRWAEFGSFETYSAREPVPSLSVGVRTTTSIQLTWTPDDPEVSGDAGVNAIWYVPASDETAEPVKVEVPESDANAGDFTLAGLDPGQKYIMTVHFGNAPRGSVSAYTLPDTENAVKVSSSEQLVQNINDGAEEILLMYSGSPYDLGYSTGEGETALSLESLDHPLTIYGEEGNGESGNFPVVYGNFSVAEGCTSLVLENIAFDGQSYDTEHLISFGAGISTTVEEVVIRNCTLTSFKRGFAYAGSNPLSINSFIIDDVVLSDTQGDGGEAIGFRGTGSFGTISITNSTLTDGSRELMRINDENTIASFVISGNTFNNLCTNSSARGLFYEMPQPASFELTKNIFLNMADAFHHSNGTVWGSNSTSLTPDPTVVSSNFYYNVGVAFFETGSGNFTEELGISGGGAVLSEDPCAESMGGDYHVMNATVLAARAGDPRWLVEGYQPEPEDLTLEAVPAPYTWDFTDASLFYSNADKNMVRGNIRFYVQSSPVEFDTSAGRLYLTAAGIMGASEPMDCAIGFKVNQPGSVVISTSPSPAYPEAHATVSLDGKHIGAVPADAEEFQVAVSDIVEGEEHMIYIYGCGPFYITSLQWSDYIGGGDTKLAVPENVAVSAPSVVSGASETVTLSWDEVPNAASYDIMLGEELFANVAGTSYEIPASTLPGVYNFTVIAKPAETDSIREQSDPSVSVRLDILETQTPVSTSETTVWGSADFEWMFANHTAGDGEAFTPSWDSYVHNNLLYYAGNTIRFNVSGGEYFWQFPGTSNEPPTRRYMSFIAGGPGRLSAVIRNASTPDPDAPRYLLLMTGAAAPDGTVNPVRCEASSKDDDVLAEWTLNDIQAGDIVTLYANNGIRVYSITWEPGMHASEGQLATPEVSIDQPSVVEGTESVTLSWPAVDGAASYDVTVDGMSPVNVTEASYVLPLAGLALGEHTISVVANPGEGSASTASYAGTAVLTIVAEGGLVPVSASSPTTWGESDFDTLLAEYGAEVTVDFVYANLNFLNGGGKCKFGSSSNASGISQTRYQFGGGGSLTKQCLQFIVPGPGTLKIEQESSGSDERVLVVARNETTVGEYPAPVDPVVTEIQIPDAEYGDKISFYSKSSGINVFSITWTPSGM